MRPPTTVPSTNGQTFAKVKLSYAEESDTLVVASAHYADVMITTTNGTFFTAFDATTMARRSDVGSENVPQIGLPVNKSERNTEFYTPEVYAVGRRYFWVLSGGAGGQMSGGESEGHFNIYDAEAAAMVFTERQIMSPGGGGSSRPSVCVTAQGVVALAWLEYASQDSPVSRIVLRTFAADGTALTAGPVVIAFADENTRWGYNTVSLARQPDARSSLSRVLVVFSYANPQRARARAVSVTSTGRVVFDGGVTSDLGEAYYVQEMAAMALHVQDNRGAAAPMWAVSFMGARAIPVLMFLGTDASLATGTVTRSASVVSRSLSPSNTSLNGTNATQANASETMELYGVAMPLSGAGPAAAPAAVCLASLAAAFVALLM